MVCVEQVVRLVREGSFKILFIEFQDGRILVRESYRAALIELIEVAVSQASSEPSLMGCPPPPPQPPGQAIISTKS